MGPLKCNCTITIYQNGIIILIGTDESISELKLDVAIFFQKSGKAQPAALTSFIRYSIEVNTGLARGTNNTPARTRRVYLQVLISSFYFLHFTHFPIQKFSLQFFRFLVYVATCNLSMLNLKSIKHTF